MRLTVAVSGATGMIGSALVGHLRGAGHSVRRLIRHPTEAIPGDVHWDPEAGVLDARDLDGCDAVVNLAGEPIAQRWSESTRRAIRQSRVRATSLLVRTAGEMRTPPRVMLSGSAVGYYGNGGDEELDESSRSGEGFLASVTRDWEGEASSLAQAGVRVVALRTGIVLSARGGALKELLPPFRLGLGGPIGGGAQWMSWVSLEDHVRAMMHLLLTDSLSGPVNIVAPSPERNAAFVHTLGAVLHRPAVIPLPGFVLELMFGEMAKETILWGQRAIPRQLLNSGFTFTHASLSDALEAALG